MNGIYLSDDIPEIFKIADASVKGDPNMTIEKEPDRDDGIMRFHTSNDVETIDDIVKNHHKKKSKEKKKKKIDKRNTEAYKAKQEEKRRLKEEQEKMEIKVEMTELIARRRMLRSKLTKLNPGSYKQSQKIAAINVELIDIEYRLNCLGNSLGEEFRIESGSKVKRTWIKVKRKAKKFVKKGKKFLRRNSRLIGEVVAPIVIAVLLAV